MVIGWFSSKNVSGGSALRSIFFFNFNTFRVIFQKYAPCQDLPTLQFWSKSDYLSWSYCPFFINFFFLILILFVLYFKNSMYFSKQSYKQRNTSKVICTFIALGDTIIDTIFTINYFTIQTQYFFPFYHSWKTIIELQILNFSTPHISYSQHFWHKHIPC